MQWCGRACKLGLVAVVLASVSFGLGPEADSNQAQLDYSKELFRAGEKAMADGDYAKALANYREGYRYAPALHIFTLNIATAADAAGDCATAKKYFQHFVDLVPEHEQRAGAQARLAELNATCAEQVTEAIPKPAAPTAKRKSRDQLEAERALNAALTALTDAHAQYAAAASRFKATKPLGRAAARKKRHAKRMRRLIGDLGVDVAPVQAEAPEAPKSAADACRRGRGRENRIVDAMETVLKWYDDKEADRVVRRFIRASERVDRPAFEDCT